MRFALGALLPLNGEDIGVLTVLATRGRLPELVPKWWAPSARFVEDIVVLTVLATRGRLPELVRSGWAPSARFAGTSP